MAHTRKNGVPCAYGDARCAGRLFVGTVGAHQHQTCPRGYRALLEAQPKSWAEKQRAVKAAKAAFEERKAARTQAKAAEPVKAIKADIDYERIALVVSQAVIAALKA